MDDRYADKSARLQHIIGNNVMVMSAVNKRCVEGGEYDNASLTELHHRSAEICRAVIAFCLNRVEGDLEK